MLRIADLTVRDVMTPSPRCIASRSRVLDVTSALLEDGLTAAPVVSVDGALQGMVSTCDLLGALRRAFTGDGAVEPEAAAALRDAPVSELLGEAELVTAPDDTRLIDACKLMVRHHVHRLAVTREDELVGILSAIDLVRALACLDDIAAARR